MEKIGFGKQPYLVYEHFDAGHPHVHIVTTNIREDGSRINTHNIGRNQSSKAREEIEQEFGLVKAEGRNSRITKGIEQVNAEKIVYGKSETKRSVINVLDAVIKQYKYTSLAELNAILKQYNVLADRGHEDGRIYKTGGLVYRVLDDQGNKVGVPIKASSIYSKPTLAKLEERFMENKEARKADRLPVRDKVNLTLEKSVNLQQFMRELNKIGIATVLRRNEAGFLYGITFIDHKSKSVFNGSDLGKTFSAAAIQERLARQNPQPENTLNPVPDIKTKEPSKEDTHTKKAEMLPGEDKTIHFDQPGKTPSLDLLEDLMQSEKGGSSIPFELRKRKRKRKRKNNNL
jgi:hypothetical protein